MTFVQECRSGGLTRLALGTVQLGLSYGVANATGKPSFETACEILDAARAAGVKVLDTAQGYGDSEEVIGRYLKLNPQADFRVISKLAPTLDPARGSLVESAVAQSREHLGRTLSALLLHNPAHMSEWDRGLGATLRSCRNRGWVEALGVSIYTQAEFELALSNPDLEVIQIPFNAFDTGLLNQGWIDRARERGKVIFARSVYLQGLLLMPLAQASARVPVAKPYLEAWAQRCADLELPPRAAALAFARAALPDAFLVLGAETPEQFRESVDTFNSVPSASKELQGIAQLFGEVPQEIKNPALWRKA